MHWHLSKHANLKHIPQTDNPALVTCDYCIVISSKANRLIINELFESSQYNHSGSKGVDRKRKIPEFVVMANFGELDRSYLTPYYLCRASFKADNPELYFQKVPTTLVVGTRALNPDQNISEKLKVFRELTKYVVDQLNTNLGLNITYSVEKSALQNSYGESVESVNFTSDMGLITSFTLLIMVGKMTLIKVAQPDAPNFRLMEQIMSNQANPKQSNYRGLMKLLFSGQIQELWENPQSYVAIFPKLNDGVDYYSMYHNPRWMSIHKPYKSEISLAKWGLFY